ncbi:MAG: T9SS type A sorting domain-containing protein, partial [Bacteroidota bacterium]
VVIIVNHDTLLSEVEIRFSNLRLMTEAPNKVCTCALTSFSNIFTNLLYVVFVDSGTNNPYPNFAQWGLDQGASNAWDAAENVGVGWDGFVSDVINNGLADDAVELVVRAGLPAGYTLVFLDSAVSSIYMGTDEYDATNAQLVGSHRGVRFSGNHGRTITAQPVSYFEGLDSTITDFFTTSLEVESPLAKLEVAPNPFSESFSVSFIATRSMDLQMELLDVNGRMIRQIGVEKVGLGFHKSQFDASQWNLSAGVYFLRMRGQGLNEVRKLVYLN